MLHYKNKKLTPTKYRTFKHSLIATAIFSMSSNVAIAQQSASSEATDETEVIEVKGVRGNIQTAQNMKMAADTFMDALSAKDMGALADRSVLEAISRLPGIAIERFSASDDPDHFGVEGGGVSVRGLTNSRTEFNHRDTFSADSGRGLSFEDVSPELMGSVQVFKNQTADMIEGGIAGTVNLNTRKPFDSDGRVLAFSADLTYTDLREDSAPTFSGLFSDNWDSDSGRFGFLVNYSNSKIKVQSDAVQVGLYTPQNRDNSLLVPRSTRLSKKLDDRDREGFASSLQWQNPDKTVLLTGEYIRSKATLSWAENVMEMDDGDQNGSLVPVEGTEFDFDNDGFFENGIITSDAGWRGGRAPGGIHGMRHVMQTRARNEESIVNDYSFNAQYTPNDTWAFQFDTQYVDATKEIFDISVMGATRAVVGLDLRGDMPDITLYGPTFNNQSDYVAGNPFTDPVNHFFRSAMDHVSDNEGTEFATRLDMQYTFDKGEIESIDFGVRHSKQKQTTRQSKYNWGNIQEAWTSGDSWYDTNDVAYDEVSFANLARGGVLKMEGTDAFLFPAISMVQDYDGLAQALSSLNPTEWVPLSARSGADGYFIPNEINQTEEIANAAYVKVNFIGDIGGMEYEANVGVRYVNRENTTAGFISYPDDIPRELDPTDPDDFDPNSVLISDQASFGNNASTVLENKSDFSKLLPSVNFKLSLEEDLLLRFGFSKALALPDLGLMRSFVSIGGQDAISTYDPDTIEDDRPVQIQKEYARYTASSGNPNLKPMEADNWDLSLEWYFAEAGSLVFSLFYKDLSNYFINGVVESEFTNNGVTQLVQVTGAVNGDEGSIKGYEISYSDFFDNLPGIWSGLGVQANYTYINENGSPNRGLNTSSVNSDDASNISFADSLPLEGLSKNNANFALLYEKQGFSGRIAYNWRSEYLLTTRDVITTLPIFNDANGQLDASVFYNINENWKVGIQGTNLNDNITHTLMQINAQGDKKSRSWFTSDRRYSLVVRGNF